MPEMLRPPERDRLIAFLERNLLHTVPVDGQDLLASRESTTNPAAWTEAAARTVELLALPHLPARCATLADRLTDFLLAMGEGPLLHRRAVAPGCRIDSADPQDFRVLTDAYEFSGDLTRGVVRQRAAGGREAVHTGHLVEFASGGAAHCLDVEDSTSHSGVVQQDDGSVLLFHESLFSARTGLMRRTRFVGRLRYEYTIRPDDPRLRLQVMLKTAPKVTLRDIRLTTALDELSGEAGQRPFNRIVLGAGGGYSALTPSGEELSTLHLGQAESLSLVEDAPAGQATGLHLGFPSARRLMSIKLVSKAPGESQDRRPHWLLSRYRVPVLAGGESATIEEERLLTAGTLPGAEDSYATLLREPAPLRGRDPGITRDIGAALNAVATRMLFSGSGAHPLPPARMTALRQWYDRHLRGFFTALAESGGQASARASLRELSFVLLSLDVMPRIPGPAGGMDHAALLSTGLEVLLACQHSQGAFVTRNRPPDLGDHAAAMLVLARLALRQPDERLTLALRQALQALHLGSMTAGQGEQAHEIPSPLFHLPTAEGGWATADGRLSADLGLLMRGLGTLLFAHRAGAVALDAAEQKHLQTLHDGCFRLLRGRLHPTATELEVLASADSTEGDAVSQSVVALGLLAPDEAVLAVPRPVPV